MLGVVISILASFSTIINIFVLFIIWHGGLLRSTNSSIYLLAFSNIVSNLIQASLIAFYLGPSIILQSFLFTDGLKGTGNSILSCLETGAWYTDMQISAVYIHIRKSYKTIHTTQFYTAYEFKRKREIRYALQFGAFSTFALIAWVGMRVMPIILNSGNIYPYVTFAVIIHGTMNSFIFLVMNKEVKRISNLYHLCQNAKKRQTYEFSDAVLDAHLKVDPYAKLELH
uniref:7TM GPCR serpentine receptor class x (Srx) domain-containing protein n=1 Tax=Acrobeloides nanus TaxID=290746 RepID=A0A914C2U7_9BILA